VNPEDAAVGCFYERPILAGDRIKIVLAQIAYGAGLAGVLDEILSGRG
jgi:hypothetical protein